jgi:hypothetical protein
MTSSALSHPAAPPQVGDPIHHLIQLHVSLLQQISFRLQDLTVRQCVHLLVATSFNIISIPLILRSRTGHSPRFRSNDQCAILHAGSNINPQYSPMTGILPILQLTTTAPPFQPSSPPLPHPSLLTHKHPHFRNEPVPAQLPLTLHQKVPSPPPHWTPQQRLPRLTIHPKITPGPPIRRLP